MHEQTCGKNGWKREQYSISQSRKDSSALLANLENRAMKQQFPEKSAKERWPICVPHKPDIITVVATVEGNKNLPFHCCSTIA